MKIVQYVVTSLNAYVIGKRYISYHNFKTYQSTDLWKKQNNDAEKDH